MEARPLAGAPAFRRLGTPVALALACVAIHHVMQGTIGNMADLRTRHAGVRRLARRLIESRRRMLENLEHVAARRNVVLSVPLGAERNATAYRLADVQPEAFDRAYLLWVLRDHRDVEPAERTLPVLAEHVRLARRVASEPGSDRG